MFIDNWISKQLWVSAQVFFVLLENFCVNVRLAYLIDQSISLFFWNVFNICGWTKSLNAADIFLWSMWNQYTMLKLCLDWNHNAENFLIT